MKTSFFISMVLNLWGLVVKKQKLVCAVIENHQGCVFFFCLNGDDSLRLPLFRTEYGYNEQRYLMRMIREFFRGGEVTVEDEPISRKTHDLKTTATGEIQVSVVVYKVTTNKMHIPGGHAEIVWTACPSGVKFDATTKGVVDQLREDQFF